MKEKSYNGFASEEQYEAVKRKVSEQIGELCLDEFKVEKHNDSGFVVIYVSGMEIPISGDDFFDVEIEWVELKGKTHLSKRDISVIKAINPREIGRVYFEEQIRSLMPF